MNLKTVFHLAITFLFTLNLNSQCKINGLNVKAKPCDVNGRFFVELSFDHSGASNLFKVQGNGTDYGTFNYTSLPVLIGPLKADCVTEYEFIVRDNANPNCVGFKTFGKNCCDNKCQIAFEKVTASACKDNKYSVELNLNYNNPKENGFDFFHNGKFVGFYKYSALPLKIDDIEASNSEAFNNLVVCANDNSGCCDTLELLNPCICSIYKIQTQIKSCDTLIKKFDLDINFKHNLTSDSFQVGGNATNYGTFAYKDLPITLKNLTINPTKEYEILIVDKKNQLCFGVVDLGIVKDCNFECNIYDVSVKESECDGENFYVKLDFSNENTSVKGFQIKGNGKNYGNYEYGEKEYLLGPLKGDCQTMYEFVVQDLDGLECKDFAVLPMPICCKKEVCELSDFTLFEFCENNFLVGFDLDFERTIVTGQFKLLINDKLFSTYSYSDLPIKITNINFDLPNVKFKIIDVENSDCFLIKEYKFKCFTPKECNVTDMNVTVLPCKEDQTFKALLKFNVLNPGIDGFSIFVNGKLLDTLMYGQQGYEIGPFQGDCETLYKFLIKDIVNPDCAEDYGFTEKVCCTKKVCSIKNLSIEYFPCKDNKYSIFLKFSHENTSEKYFVKVNGIQRGPFNYADLPLKIEDLNSKETVTIIIRDQTNEACRIEEKLPVRECTSGISEEANAKIAATLINDVVKIELPSSLQPSKIELFDLSGKLHYENIISEYFEKDISNLPNGVYILRFQTNGKVIVKKILKR